MSKPININPEVQLLKSLNNFVNSTIDLVFIKHKKLDSNLEDILNLFDQQFCNDFYKYEIVRIFRNEIIIKFCILKNIEYKQEENLYYNYEEKILKRVVENFKTMTLTQLKKINMTNYIEICQTHLNCGVFYFHLKQIDSNDSCFNKKLVLNFKNELNEFHQKTLNELTLKLKNSNLIDL
jgi:hypothetical protein